MPNRHGISDNHLKQQKIADSQDNEMVMDKAVKKERFSENKEKDQWLREEARKEEED